MTTIYYTASISTFVTPQDRHRFKGYGWLIEAEAQGETWAGWRYSTMELGAQFVTMAGVLTMVEWFASKCATSR